MNIHKIVVIFFSILLIGCSKEEIDKRVSYQIIEEGNLSYTEEIIPKQFVVFENEKDWMEFLPQIEERNPSQAENLENLDFDFNNNSLILIIGEFYNNCCSSITINKVYRDENNLKVEFQETGPGLATALSQAFLVLRVPTE